MMNFIDQTYRASLRVSNLFEKLHSIAALVVRLYIVQVFFNAGLTKIQSWDTTLFLFEEEYQVPFLAPEFAAYLGTFSELFFPALLFLGLTTRFSALGLFAVNFVAVLSLEAIAPAAFYLHVIWGILLVHLIIYGGGSCSLDRIAFFLQQKFRFTGNKMDFRIRQ